MRTHHFLLKNWLYAVAHDIPGFWSYPDKINNPELRAAFLADGQKALEELAHEKKKIDELKKLMNEKRSK